MFEMIMHITGVKATSDFQVVLQDGDNEVGILPSSAGWRLVACNIEQPHEAMFDETHATLLAAINAMRAYLFNEYAGPDDVPVA